MLKQRLLTAFLLAPLVISGVWWLPNNWVALLLALGAGLGISEWARLAGCDSRFNQRVLLLGGVLGLISVGVLLAWDSPTRPWALILFTVASLGWSLLTRQLLRIRSITPATDMDQAVALIGLGVLISAWAALVWLHAQPHGPQLLLFLLLLIWLADSGAYFVGRRFGRIKLAPIVSPGKTLEGVYGALGVAVVSGGVLAGWQGHGGWRSLGYLGLCLLTVAASIVGDLYESQLKRARGFKDSGTLLPGHGGILDRIDSLTAAAPVFALGLSLLRYLP